MNLSKNTIGNLINRYKAVLKKCHLLNTFGSLAVAGMLVMGGVGVVGDANAANVVIDASTTELTTTNPGSDTETITTADAIVAGETIDIDVTGEVVSGAATFGNAATTNGGIIINLGTATSGTNSLASTALSVLGHDSDAKSFTLNIVDGLQYTVSGAYTDNANSILDIKDGTLKGASVTDGSFKGATNIAAGETFEVGGNLTVANADLFKNATTATVGGIYVGGTLAVGGTLTVDDSTTGINMAAGGKISATGYDFNASTTLISGTVKLVAASGGASQDLEGTLRIDESTDGAAKVLISGGDWSFSSPSLYVTDGTLQITGGSATFEPGELQIANDAAAVINLDGGTFTADVSDLGTLGDLTAGDFTFTRGDYAFTGGDGAQLILTSTILPHTLSGSDYNTLQTAFTTAFGTDIDIDFGLIAAQKAANLAAIKGLIMILAL